jgi:hypothetical protein
MGASSFQKSKEKPEEKKTQRLSSSSSPKPVTTDPAQQFHRHRLCLSQLPGKLHTFLFTLHFFSVIACICSFIVMFYCSSEL